ncbi:MAG TPA: carboxymuconolactone decarboxylase family protein [Gemmatimonadales bacterium]|nr:carboxymuconolactone decarboxylase family protein [Gemmatimonadales bacterium]
MSALWPLDRVAAWVGAPRRASPARLPGPLGLPAYARLARTWSPIAPLEPRLLLLVSQLAAERSGCPYCIAHGRHMAQKAGISPEAVDAVVQYSSAGQYSEAERAALALADAVTRFSETDGGFPPEVLVRARCHFDEGQIVALVAAVAAEHFFDPATGRLGRDALAVGVS